jgi:hypothetical protein
MFGWLVFAWLAAEAEKTEEALNPATARTRTKVRIAMCFIIGISPKQKVQQLFLRNFA